LAQPQGSGEGGERGRLWPTCSQKDIIVDDVTMANVIEAMLEVETVTTSEAAPSASTGATAEEGRLKKSPLQGFHRLNWEVCS
jgi:hypothetical protein